MKMIRRVTITGADNSVSPTELQRLSHEFPFVEWGILVKRKAPEPSPRYPDWNWFYELLACKRQNRDMQLAMHVCSFYSRQLISGSPDLFNDFWWALRYFNRIQVNSASLHNNILGCMAEDLRDHPEWEYIFQNQAHAVELCEKFGVRASLLFDESGGRGQSPEYLKLPIDGIRCGYAGGIGPDNIRQTIESVNTLSGDTPVWIDMESRVRDEQDRFDLAKVRQCLEVASEYVTFVLEP